MEDGEAYGAAEELGFRVFARCADILSAETSRRSRLLSQLVNEETTQLTTLGVRTVASIFSFFDEDGDGALSDEELTRLNQAAGLELSPESCEWVRAEFDTNEMGWLTLRGYSDLVRRNLAAIPRETFLDLQALLFHVVSGHRDRVLQELRLSAHAQQHQQHHQQHDALPFVRSWVRAPSFG